MNAQYKSKKRFLKGVLRIIQFYKDFTIRDKKIAELIAGIMPELEHESNVYINQIRLNQFINNAQIHNSYGSTMISERETYYVTVNDGNGKSHQERRERTIYHTVNYVTDSKITHSNAFIKI